MVSGNILLHTTVGNGRRCARHTADSKDRLHQYGVDMGDAGPQLYAWFSAQLDAQWRCLGHARVPTEHGFPQSGSGQARVRLGTSAGNIAGITARK